MLAGASALVAGVFCNALRNALFSIPASIATTYLGWYLLSGRGDAFWLIAALVAAPIVIGATCASAFLIHAARALDADEN